MARLSPSGELGLTGRGTPCGGFAFPVVPAQNCPLALGLGSVWLILLKSPTTIIIIIIII